MLESLAQQIARDGEGAKKLITIAVTGAPSDDGAARIARTIANSPLVKTAIAGSDPNWGRILSAAGNAGVAFDPAQDRYRHAGRRGLPRRPGRAVFRSRAEEEAGRAGVRDPLRRAARARAQARFWTCDFTEGYIRINASYRT